MCKIQQEQHSSSSGSLYRGTALGDDLNEANKAAKAAAAARHGPRMPSVSPLTVCRHVWQRYSSMLPCSSMCRQTHCCCHRSRQSQCLKASRRQLLRNDGNVLPVARQTQASEIPVATVTGPTPLPLQARRQKERWARVYAVEQQSLAQSVYGQSGRVLLWPLNIVLCPKLAGHHEVYPR